jgi:hypothetical protein
MGLQGWWNDLDAQFTLFSSHLQQFIAAKPVLKHPLPVTHWDECFLEGLLSRMWQAWCGFCRNCVIDSCLGTVTSSGTTLAAVPGAATEGHVSRAAIQAKSRKSITWTPSNSLLRGEPTWGDPDVLNVIVSDLKPQNAAQLLAAISSAHDSAKALQLIRNAAAHDNPQSMAELLKIQAKYNVFPIMHATHALFWVVPGNGAFLVSQAVTELRQHGQSAIA